MANDASDLNVVHGDHHRGGRAALPQGLAHRRKLADGAPEAPELLRHAGRQEALFLERIDRFPRKARFAIDAVGRRARDFVGDLAHLLEKMATFPYLLGAFVCFHVSAFRVRVTPPRSRHCP
jgi:hypothetical protein